MLIYKHEDEEIKKNKSFNLHACLTNPRYTLIRRLRYLDAVYMNTIDFYLSNCLEILL